MHDSRSKRKEKIEIQELKTTWMFLKITFTLKFTHSNTLCITSHSLCFIHFEFSQWHYKFAHCTFLKFRLGIEKLHLPFVFCFGFALRCTWCCFVSFVSFFRTLSLARTRSQVTVITGKKTRLQQRQQTDLLRFCNSSPYPFLPLLLFFFFFFAPTTRTTKKDNKKNGKQICCL